MKEKKQKNTAIFIFAVIIIIALILIFISSGTDATAELTSCINDNSFLYVQEDCGACAQQEAMFKEFYSLLNPIDCKYEQEQCTMANIRAAPTWIIKGKLYEGVQKINKLKQLTGC